MINDRLNKNAIKTLKWAVHLYTFAGYWFLTNRQIFYDDATPKSRRSDLEITHHTIYHFEFDHTFPLLDTILYIILNLIIRFLY